MPGNNAGQQPGLHFKSQSAPEQQRLLALSGIATAAANEMKVTFKPDFSILLLLQIHSA